MRFCAREMHSPMKNRAGFWLLAAVIVFFLAGCAGKATSPVVPTGISVTDLPTAFPPTITSNPQPSTTAAPTTATESATPTPAFTSTPTLTPTLAATSTLEPLALPARLPAKSWKQWPVIPEITNRAREIYQQGRLRNDPHAFSKVGDCQGIKEVWLGVYDQPGLYTLAPENADLQETIDWFAGSFNRNGFAVMGGYNARAVLQPAVADPAYCQAGESPIECEYRLHHPSIVLVSLEFYYDGRTTQNYEQYMREILDFFIARGTLPILATKADNMEGDESLNLTTARLAEEYDLPLWNFWRAVQPLPNHGMDITRPDGFHISVDAWRERSATSLQALDTVWRSVRDLACADNTSLGCDWPVAQSPTATPVPDPSTRVVLSIAERTGGSTRSQGIFLLDTQDQTLTRLLDAGYQLQDVSADGTQLLVNQGSDLYLANVKDPKIMQKLAADFYPYGQTGAAWLPDGKSVVMILEREGRGIWQMAVANGSAQRLTPQDQQPFELLASPSSGEIFWADGGCQLDEQGLPITGECQSGGWYRSATDGAAPLGLGEISRPLRSPDRVGLAYSYLTGLDQATLAITASGQPQVWTPLPAGNVLDYSWSPSGRWLAALWQERSDYSGKIMAQKLYLLNRAENRSDAFPVSINLDGQVRWSPDGRWLLVSGTETNAEGYRLNLRLIPANGGNITVLDGKMGPSGANFVFISNLYWIP